jgi:hypothetical protein
LINTNQQIGGAIGVAVASTIFISHSKDLVKTGHPLPAALTSGYQWAFWALIAVAVVGALAAFVLIPGGKVAIAEGEPVQAPV